MTTHDGHSGHDDKPQKSDRAQDRGSWLITGLMFVLLGVIAYYVIAEHGAHTLSIWPLLFLLACPLMHMFHGGHGGHGGQSSHKPVDPDQDGNERAQ